MRQTITPVQDAAKLKKFLRKLHRVKDEDEVPALLAQLSHPAELKIRMEGELEGLREAILTIIGTRFSTQLGATVRLVIAAVQDPEQLKKFLRQLIQKTDEQAVIALLSQSFPVAES